MEIAGWDSDWPEFQLQSTIPQHHNGRKNFWQPHIPFYFYLLTEGKAHKELFHLLVQSVHGCNGLGQAEQPDQTSVSV